MFQANSPAYLLSEKSSMGWFTITPSSGPSHALLPIHRQILQEYSETALLIAFHASDLHTNSSPVGKLPLTIYESVYEEENAPDGDKPMHDDGQRPQQPNLTLKFRELPYSIETGEAEMIGVDFVAKGGGNATAIPVKAHAKGKKSSDSKSTAGSSKNAETTTTDEGSALSREDEDSTLNYPDRIIFSSLY